MRKTDDIIVNTINSVVRTDSFHTDDAAACKNLYENLEDGNKKREKFIQNCIDITSVKVNKLKEESASSEGDLRIKKQLKAEQTKVLLLRYHK